MVIVFWIYYCVYLLAKIVCRAMENGTTKHFRDFNDCLFGRVF